MEVKISSYDMVNAGGLNLNNLLREKVLILLRVFLVGTIENQEQQSLNKQIVIC